MPGCSPRDARNQCSFKTEATSWWLAVTKKLKKPGQLSGRGERSGLVGGAVTSFKFEVSGHTDSSGKPEHNKELSGKRAAVIEREIGGAWYPQERDRGHRHGLGAPTGQRPTTRRPRRRRSPL